MNILKIKLEHCYGIKKLDKEFDFTEKKVKLFYAGNGIMKSSFARVFKDLSDPSQKTLPKDIFFPKRITKCSVLDENDTLIPPSKIFVIDPPQKKYECKRISTLLVNEALKSEYDDINQSYFEQKEAYLSSLRKISKFKGDLESELRHAFNLNEEQFRFYEDFYKIVSESIDPGFSKISYLDIFNPQVLKLFENANFKKQILEYVEKFDDLVSKCTYFKPDFNHINASEISLSLKTNKFFLADNHLLLDNQGEKQLITSAEDLEKIFEEEKQKVLNDPELQDRFSAIDTALNKNAEAKKFRLFLNANKQIVPELANLEEFKRKLWISYAFDENESLLRLVDLGNSSKKRVEEIIQTAREESTKWKKVVDEFNRRFSLPYTLDVSNQHKVLLNAEAPSIVFTYIDGVEKEIVSEEALEQSLSTGEKKAWYLLNIIFEIEARKNDPDVCLLIIDDIADSFDYKNKFAIIEYLKEIVETNKFHTMILSHNFDFFRTVRSRLDIKRDACFMPVKTSTGINIEQAGYFENPLQYWKDLYPNDKKAFISMVTMVRNLIEYREGQDCDEYHQLTSLLHIKETTQTITANEIIGCFNKIITPKPLLADDYLMIDAIFSSADEIQADVATDIKLENKIILSIAMRLKAEMFIKKYIKNGETIFFPKNQARKLLDVYRSEFSDKTEQLEVLDRIALMTPENIHLNSFMYEPLMDLSDVQLKELYGQVKGLTH